MEVIMKSSGANLKVDLKTTRKLLKPQVEKRRRERMNRSLESLRALLLQGSQHQALASRRVEKAEVLEHTVLFLQSAAHRGAAEGSQQQDFQDGFSTCLQRAARFLRDSRAGRRGEGALSVTLSRHLTHLGPLPRAPISPHSAHTQPKGQSAQLGGKNWHCSQQHGATLRNSPSHQLRAALAHRHPNLPQPSHREALSPPTNSQSPWRPWS
ncbi:transcription factor HES-2-like [Anguilla anguilla]|uniref:transcription factor HES-2-like n=1 Tax=Anguilla anguilla TaxID=7936 RepID=UPI0015AFB5B5|nr:transcription factor HES-2-like [Anguilla anguilla]